MTSTYDTKFVAFSVLSSVAFGVTLVARSLNGAGGRSLNTKSRL